MEAIAGAIAVTQAVVSTCRAIDSSVTAINGASETLQRWTVTSRTLRTTYEQLAIILQESKSTRLPREPGGTPYYEAIETQLDVFHQELEKLERNISKVSLDSSTTPSLKDKVWLAFRIRRVKDDQLFEWIDRHIRFLSVHVELTKALNDHNMDNIQRALGNGLAESEEETESEGESEAKPNAWRVSATNLATQLALRNFPSLGAEAPDAAEPGWDFINVDHAGSSTVDTVSLRERELRFKATLRNVNHLETANLPVLAANVQLVVIRLQDELNEAKNHSPSFTERFSPKERYIKLLLRCRRTHTVFGTRAQKYLDHHIIPELDERDSELRDIWLSVGKMYYDMKVWEQAEKFLRLALFRGYIECETDTAHSEIEEISKLVCRIYEEEGHPQNAVALRQELKLLIGYDPTPSGILEKALEWCHGKGFQVKMVKDQLVFDNLKNEKDNTALHEAVLDAKVDIAIMPSLMTDDTVTLKNASGDTALLLAIDKSNEAVVKNLLGNPSLLQVRDREGATPLHRCRNHEILGLVLGAIEKSRNRSSSTYEGPNSVDASFLININSTDVYGRTALFVMCEQGNLRMMKQLLEAGADVTKRDELRRSPMLACLTSNVERGKKEEMILRLLEKNADPDEEDKYGNTARSELRRSLSSKRKAKQFLEQDPKVALLAIERGSASERGGSNPTTSTTRRTFSFLGLFS